MFCSECGFRIAELAKFCPQCGTALAPPPAVLSGTRAVRRGRTGGRILWIVGVCVGLLFLLLAIASVRNGKQLDEVLDSEAAKHAARQEQGTPQGSEPPLAGVSLHAYDALKNPYGHKNQLVVLDVIERPVLFNGSLIQYAGGADPKVLAQVGMAGVRFNKMLAEDTALYDVMGLNANNNSDAEVLGQLAVLLPAGRGELDLTRGWDIEPLGTAEGTNGFGATIRVPEVRFWRYSDERQQAPTAAALSSDAVTAINLVKSRIRPSPYLLSLKPDLSSAKWNAVDNHFDCPACWYVFYSAKVATNRWDRDEAADWKVNLALKAVTASNDKARMLYDLTPP